MPLPKPDVNESRDNFLKRCISDKAVGDEFPDNDQKYAVCSNIFETAVQKANAPEEAAIDDKAREDMQYVLDRMEMEEDFDPEEPVVISIGDYVRFEVAGGTYRGRVLNVVNSGGSVMSTGGTKLDGLDDDPAVLIRLYREGDEGYEESDIKVVHRMSSLIKIPSLMDMKTPMHKSQTGQRETKVFAFKIVETKEVDIDGKQYGIIRGYASTYGNVDRGNDKVLSGAFKESIEEYKANGRPIKMCYQHSMHDIIGGYPADKIRDDSVGLYVEGHINLEVQKGREAYALAKQGVICDMSIGYILEDYQIKQGVRELKKIKLCEISMVGEPMNPEARIMSVKSVVPFEDLPLAAEKNHPWDAEAALARIKEFTNSMDRPSETYRKAFMWYDPSHPEDFTSYKYPYADVVKGKLVAIPNAIQAVKDAMNNADVTSRDKKSILGNIERYEAKMDMKYIKPFNPDDITLFTSAKNPQEYKEDILENISPKQITYDDALGIKTKRDLEKVLRESGLFTKRAAIYLSSQFNDGRSDSVEKIEINEVKKLINYLNGVKNGNENGGSLFSS